MEQNQETGLDDPERPVRVVDDADQFFSPSEAPVSKPVLLDFPDALRHVIKGKRITKLEWGDRELWVYLFHFPESSNDDTPAGNYLAIRKHGNVAYRFTPNDGDLLGNDWLVLE